MGNPALHARLSPSDAERWMNCAGAVGLCDRLKQERKGNFYSAEGTFAHTVREVSLDLGLDPDHLIGMKGREEGYDFVLDEDMAAFLQPGIDHIRQFEGPMTVEYKVDLSRWMPGQFGTLDLGIAGEKLIVISDLKYGAGLPVSPVENKQQMIYALGYWDQVARHITDATDFLILIDQPRHGAGGGEWRTTLDELLAFGETIETAARATEDPNAPRCASAKACYWCPASKIAGACPEHEAFVLSIVASSFDDLDDAMKLGLPPSLPPIFSLTPERRAFIVQNASVFTKWLDRLHDDTLEAAIQGEKIPGMKAVAGRASPRRWTNKADAEELVSEIIGTPAFKFVLKTPTQLEKEFGDKVYNKISHVVTRGDSKPQLVHESDSREPLKPTAEKFDILD